MPMVKIAKQSEHLPYQERNRRLSAIANFTRNLRNNRLYVHIALHIRFYTASADISKYFTIAHREQNLPSTV